MRSEASRFARHIALDRSISREDIDTGIYPHADRGLDTYYEWCPRLKPVLATLASALPHPRGLDVGCGTGRAAAEMMTAYRTLDMQGVTLTFHPPVTGHTALPRERIHISHAGSKRFSSQRFDLLTAVGSLDVSDTLAEEGPRVLDLVAPGGFFILTSSIWMSDRSPALLHVMAYGQRQYGMTVRNDTNYLNNFSITFHRPA